VSALPVLMVLPGPAWFAMIWWRLRTPQPRRERDRRGPPATATRVTPDRLASLAPTPLADEVEEWLQRR
jgi:hypothetical protein